MANKRLSLLEAQKGKQFDQGPSPLSRWLNGKLIDVSEGNIVMEYYVRKEMTNPVGMLHGGMICAILDEVIGMTSYTLDIEYFHPSVNLNVDYLASAREGDTVIVKTELIKQGRNVIHIEGKLFNPEGKLLAKGSANLFKSHIKIS